MRKQLSILYCNLRRVYLKPNLAEPYSNDHEKSCKIQVTIAKLPVPGGCGKLDTVV